MRTLSLILSRDIAGASAADYVRAGRAARALGRFQQANDFFREAVDRGPDRRRTPTSPGASCSSRSTSGSEAARSFEAALRGDAEHPAALLGMARTVARRQPAAGPQAGRSRRSPSTPTRPARTCCWRELALDDLKRDDAKAEIDKALAINPNHLEALSLSAALAWLEKRTADQAAATDAVLKINPLYGEVHRVIGGVSARAYRFDEAAEFARKASALDRENYRAFADLGAHLMRTGDERARAAGARDRLPRRSLRRRHLQPARPARHPRRLRDDPRRRPGHPAAPRRGRR